MGALCGGSFGLDSVTALIERQRSPARIPDCPYVAHRDVTGRLLPRAFVGSEGKFRAWDSA